MKYWNYPAFKLISLRIKRGYSPLILLCGNPGVGKTALGALMSEVITIRVHGRLNGYMKDVTQDLSPDDYEFLYKKFRWNPVTNCFYDIEKLSYTLLDAKHQVILIAEAGHDLASDDWNSPANRFFNRVLVTQRIQSNCYLVNAPVAKGVARSHRRMIDYLIDIKGRGEAWFHVIKIKNKALVGDEFVSRYKWKLKGYPLPKCWNKLIGIDEENKNIVKVNLREEMLKKMGGKQGTTQTQMWGHKCLKCGRTWTSGVEIPYRCDGCRTRFNSHTRENINIWKVN